MSRVSNRAGILACAILAVFAHPAFPNEPLAPVGFLQGRNPGAVAALFIMPVSGATLSSGFGSRLHPILGVRRAHEGVDWSAPAGTSIVAVAEGVVVSAGWESGYGYTTRIRHAGSVETVYAHQSQIVAGLAAGDVVDQGQPIGAVGSTGLATGPHLHFEILIDGRPIDPLGDEMRQLGERLQLARLR